MMHLLGTLVVGFVVGLIARAIMPGTQAVGVFMTAILGVVGAVVAGFLGQALGLYQAGQPIGWIASVIGAILVLFIYGKVSGGSR